MPDPVMLWEILVPTSWKPDKRPVRTKHHRSWDQWVRRITNGMTIYRPAFGQWIDPNTRELYQERMIPVRITCTEKQIHQIAKFTIKHYEQLAVMVYVVSEKVLIINSDEQERQNKAPD